MLESANGPTARVGSAIGDTRSLASSGDVLSGQPASAQVPDGPSAPREAEDASRVEVPMTRTSQLLRDVLRKNPVARAFSVERILASIGADHAEASLVLFSLPAILPVPVPRGVGTVPAGALGFQMATGHERLKIPAFVLKKSVSRRALAVAIHAALPILEAAEKILRPRWSWVSHANTRRALGLFIFILAVAIAHPFLGFGALHATSIFVMALGMAEQDGLAVLIGVAVGLVSLAVVAASTVSARAVYGRCAVWFRRVLRQLGISWLATRLKEHGYERLAHFITLRLGNFLLLWDPERPAKRKAARRRSPPRVATLTPAVRAPRAA